MMTTMRRDFLEVSFVCCRNGGKVQHITDSVPWIIALQELRNEVGLRIC